MWRALALLVLCLVLSSNAEDACKAAGYRCLPRCWEGWSKVTTVACKKGDKVCCTKGGTVPEESTGSEESQEEEEIKEPTCAEIYKSSTHTMCLNETGKGFEVKSSDKKAILEMHNKLRAGVQAADMLTVTWDDEIAEVARKWAANCVWKHDAYLDRNIPWRFPLGQNLMYHTKGDKPDWSRPINAWAAEAANFKYGVGSVNGKMVGHWTQMIWAKSALIGCGVALCPKYGYFYACDYGVSGNVISSSTNPKTPYSEGKPASMCKKKKKFDKKKVCRCSLACENGGVLDLKTCKCKCLKYAHIKEKKGQCTLLCKEARDNVICSFYKSKSKTACVSIKEAAQKCPKMCGVCPTTT